jgi:hypothetical protein
VSAELEAAILRGGASIRELAQGMLSLGQTLEVGALAMHRLAHGFRLAFPRRRIHRNARRRPKLARRGR